jgi:ABC-type multidrug transport system permease subunit
MKPGSTMSQINGSSLEAGGVRPAAEVKKYISDVFTIVEMKIRFMVRGWYWYAIRPLVFPLGVLFWLNVMVPDDQETNIRIMAGAIVFGISLSTANMLSQQVLQDRFLGRLKLLVTMPVSKSAYATGVLFFSTIQALPIVVILLVFSGFTGVDLEISWPFLPLILMTLLSVAGMGLFISSVAPTIEVGGIMSNLFGIVLVMISPVFFTMDQAPLALKIVGWASPMRYAADGITKTISGNNDVWLELIVLAAFTLVSMTIGLKKLSWQEK